MNTPKEPKSPDSPSDKSNDGPSDDGGSRSGRRTGRSARKRPSGEAPNRTASNRAARNKSDADEIAPLLRWLIAILVSVAVTSGVVAFLWVVANQSADTDGVEPLEAEGAQAAGVKSVEISDADIFGTPLLVFSVESPDPAVGEPAPSIRSSTFDGSEITVDLGDGRAKVIAFFAHWCPHCQRELPRIAKWLAESQLPDGVDLIAVSTNVDSQKPNYPPSAWFEEVGWSETVLNDSGDNAIATGYGLSGFPYTVLVDGRGDVVVRFSGELSDDQWELLISEAAAAVG